MLKTFAEQVYIEQVLDPIDHTGEGVDILPATYIDVSDFERFAFLICVGDMTGTLDAQVVQATAAAGTNSKDIVGAAITQLGASDDNKQVLVEVETRRLDINNGFHFVAIELTEAGSTAQLVSVTFLGINPGHAPVAQHAGVDELVLVVG